MRSVTAVEIELRTAPPVARFGLLAILHPPAPGATCLPSPINRLDWLAFGGDSPLAASVARVRRHRSERHAGTVAATEATTHSCTHCSSGSRPASKPGRFHDCSTLEGKIRR